VTPPPEGSPAGAISAATGTDLSHTALWSLRTGRVGNPTLKTIHALAKFFHVPPSYFTDDPESEAVAEQIALLTLLRDAGITGTALRALSGLDPDTRRAVTEMLARAAAAHGVPGDGT
jgi:transcriptional regulator with XRE-family HTH domain